MDEQYLLSVIASAMDLIHKEILMRNAYDVGLISKDHYQDYLKTMLYIPKEKLKESFEAEDKEWGTMEERLGIKEGESKK